MRIFKVKCNSLDFEFKSNKSYSILSLCKREGIEAPHSCFEGRCGLCKARLIDGQVDENMTRTLSPKLRAQNYILTCQSIPKSDIIQIDFDGE